MLHASTKQADPSQPMREGDYTPRQEHQQELSLGSGTCGLHSCTSPKFPVSFIAGADGELNAYFVLSTSTP